MFTKVLRSLTKPLLIALLAVGIFLSMPVTANAQTADVCGVVPCAFTLNDFDAQNLDREGVLSILLVIVSYLVFIAGPVAILAIIVGGIYLIFGRGEQGWNLIKNALIGFVVIILATTVVNIISQILI